MTKFYSKVHATRQLSQDGGLLQLQGREKSMSKACSALQVMQQFNGFEFDQTELVIICFSVFHPVISIWISHVLMSSKSVDIGNESSFKKSDIYIGLELEMTRKCTNASFMMYRLQ